MYVPDDGTIEFQEASGAYGYEVKSSVAVTRCVSPNAGVTRAARADFAGNGGGPVLNALHLVANAALTEVGWHGWNGSLRVRAIESYRLDSSDLIVLAAGYLVLDLGVAKQVRRGVELSCRFENLTNRPYFETQNYFSFRVTPGRSGGTADSCDTGLPVQRSGGSHVPMAGEATVGR